MDELKKFVKNCESMSNKIENGNDINSQYRHCEFEIRIKQVFITDEGVRLLKKKLEEEMICSETINYDEYRYANGNLVYRAIENEIITKKSLLYNKTIDKYVSFHLNLESETTQFVHTKATKMKKSRTTYTFTSCKLDITKIHEDYQIEIESLDVGKIDIDEMLVVCKNVLNILIVDLSVTEEYMKALRYQHQKLNRRYQKPVTMIRHHINDIVQKDYYTTMKINGLRCFILMIHYKTFNLGQMRYLSDSNYKRATLLDCEYIPSSNKYIFLDILIYEDNDVTSLSLVDRQSLLKKIKITINSDEKKSTTITVETKYYKKIHNYEDIVRSITLSENENTLYDGILFVGGNGYHDERIYKLKHENTVDLKWKDDGKLYSNDNILVKRKVTNIKKSNMKNGKVYEFSYNRLTETLCYIKEREASKYANNYKVVLINLNKSINCNDVKKSIGCYFMRYYHNELKKDVLQGFITRLKKKNICSNYDSKEKKFITILDIGTGQGGDLYKWKAFEKDINCIICIEKNKKQLIRLSDRVKQVQHLSDKIRIIPKSVKDIEIKTDIPEYIHIITCFFCLNLFLQSDIDKLFNIIKTKKPVYIAFIYMTQVESYKCDSYTLVKKDDKYTIKIEQSYVDKQTERIIKTKKLNKEILKYNYKLIYNSSLDGKRFMMSDNERRLSSMYELCIYKN